jgi:hypothetical protein
MRSVMDDLADLTNKIDGYMSDDRQRAVSDAAVDKLLASFVDLRGRADLYRDALEIRMDDLGSAMASAEARAKALHTADAPAKVSDMKVRASIVDTFDRLTDALDDDADGVMVATAADMEAAGVCASGVKWAKYYRPATRSTRAGNGCRALAALGYRGDLDETTQTLTISPDDGETAETAETVEDETAAA